MDYYAYLLNAFTSILILNSLENLKLAKRKKLSSKIDLI